MKLKNTIITLTLSTICLFNTLSVHASSNISVEKTEYTITVSNESGSQTTIDISKATFYDKNGQVTEKPNFINYDVSTTTKDNTTTLSFHETPSLFRTTWQKGSGYSICTGFEVKHRHLQTRVDVNFLADFEIVQSYNDSLHRIYDFNIKPAWMQHQNISLYRKGVFRQHESLGHKAYGGVEFMSTSPQGGDSQYGAVYLVIGNDGFNVTTSEPR